jgi:adenylosuccinate synthase
MNCWAASPLNNSLKRMRATILVDLGFGDAGKGLLTDFLARRSHAGLVVRYNGGAQAGHNVVAPDGRHHTFSQFGSGSFIPGVKTYLSKHVVIHPGALLVEGDILAGKGVKDAFSRLRISDQALVISPFHQAANHIRELERGQGRHGSCGVGVGEAVEDALENPADSIQTSDLSNLPRLRQKLHAIRQRKRSQLLRLYGRRLREGTLAREWEFFEREDVAENWIASIAPIGEMGLVAPEAVLAGWLSQEESVIFEGAQGILLDAEAGFHPYTTWSRCSAANALEMIQEMAPGAQIWQVGVMRCYAVRHGPGPLPTETDVLAPVISEHNQDNPWQGRVRYGWFDGVLARYALAAAGKVDALALTHLDVLPRLDKWLDCSHYEAPGGLPEALSGRIENLPLSVGLSLAQRERFTQALFQVRPALERCPAQKESVIEKIEALLGQPVGLISRGPQAKDVQWIRR